MLPLVINWKTKTPTGCGCQNETFRRNALGNFDDAAQGDFTRPGDDDLSRSLQQSLKEHPNENWARELMELFTLGIGNYSEQDIRESARAFTSYRIDLTKQQFRLCAGATGSGPQKLYGTLRQLRRATTSSKSSLQQPACPRVHRAQTVAFFRRGRTAARNRRYRGRCTARHMTSNCDRFCARLFSSAEFYSERVHPFARSKVRSNSSCRRRKTTRTGPFRRRVVTQNAHAANGPDPVRAAQCERLGRRQILDQHFDAALSL